MRLSVEYSWRDLGAIFLNGTKLVFPTAPETPGLYRFNFGDRMIYIGETDRLKRRFQHYRTPGPTQTTNIRMNAILAEVLGKPEFAYVSVVTVATVEVEGVRTALDLSHKSARLLLENAALTAARLAGTSVANL